MMTYIPEPPSTARLEYSAEGKEPITQLDGWSNRRVSVVPRDIHVNATRYLTGRVKMYVSIEGFTIRISDGAPSTIRGRVTYWWEHEHPSMQLDSAPAWVQVLANDARVRLLEVLK